MSVICDKCGRNEPIPSRYHRTCNRHIASEPTNYCQGIMRPAGQFSTSAAGPPTWTNPGQGKKDGFQNQ